MNKRVLLKLSGESLIGSQSSGIDVSATKQIALSLKEMHTQGMQVGLVIGGGNILRGSRLTNFGMARTPADQIGMLATLMNGIALQETLHSISCPAQVFSALECTRVVQTYNWHNVISSLESGNITIFVGGTGNPYFTTDTAAAMRAGEINADFLLKATKVDGIYNKDPMQFPDAKMYKQISYSQMLSENLAVMDATSVALCRSNKVPIFVFNMKYLNELNTLLNKQNTGTLVTGD